MGLPLLLLTLVAATAAAAALAYAVVRGRRELLRPTLLLGAAWAAAYAALLVTVSLASEERVLEWNEPKKFCGFYLDCHTQVAVAGVETATRLGPPGAEQRAAGVFHVVTLEIASDAKAVTMRLVAPRLVVLDDAGRRFERVAEAEVALGAQPPLTLPVEPGGAYRTKVVFDLPADAPARNPRLLVQRGDVLERLSELVLIGDEDSFLHKPTTIRLRG